MRIKSKKKLVINIVDLFVWLSFILLSIFLIANVIRLSNIENLIRIIIIILVIVIDVLLFIFRKKKRILIRVLVIILSLIYGFVNYTFYKVYSNLDNIVTNVETKSISLVTTNKDIDDINDITSGDIAIISSVFSLDFYEMGESILFDKKLENKLVEYDDYFQIINALLNGEVEYAFLPENYNDIYNIGSEEQLDFVVLYTEYKEIEIDDEADTASIDGPFSILLMGTDVILDSYNADTLMLLTVNPKTMSITMLSIPRDTYAVIACSGGKHKINASGWYGDSCVVSTVEKYLDINIDYYAKINFLGIVDLVDKLGGIEVDVPYAFCEQNSKRQFGTNMIYVDEGLQTLNGEQALALSRNRHYWKEYCSSEYTTDGDRSDLTRGENQQLVIKAILSKLMTVRDVDKFYGILDTIGDNMTTNMSKETILSFYNVGKDIIKRLNANDTEDILNVNRLSFRSHSANVLISGLELSVIVNYNESIQYVSKKMKENLELIDKERILTFSFDINEDYDGNVVRYDRLTFNLELLPNFVGKSLNEANDYCNKNGLKCESSSNNINAIISSQSIGANTDVSTIRNKTIVFEVNSTYKDDLLENSTDDISGDENIEDLYQDNDSSVENDDVTDSSVSSDEKDEEDNIDE